MAVEGTNDIRPLFLKWITHLPFVVWEVEACRASGSQDSLLWLSQRRGDSVTDNTHVWTSDELEPRCNWKMNEWYGLLTHWNVLGSFEFHIKAALGSSHVGNAQMRRELCLIVEELHNDITEEWSLLRLTFLPLMILRVVLMFIMLCCSGDESRLSLCHGEKFYMLLFSLMSVRFILSQTI